MTALKDTRMIDAVAIAQRAHDAAARLLGSASLKRDDLTIVSASLLATIIDGLGAVIALVSSVGQGHANTVNRSLIEALGDLHHLAADPNYLLRLQLTSAQKRKAIAQSFIEQRLGDPGTTLEMAMAKREAQQASEVVKLLERKVKSLGPGARVNAPNLPKDVQGVYALHCSDAHHDLTALHSRHFRGDRLIFGDTLSIGEALSSLRNATFVAAIAISEAGTFLTIEQTQIEDTFGRMRGAVEQLTGMYRHETAAQREALGAQLGTA